MTKMKDKKFSSQEMKVFKSQIDVMTLSEDFNAQVKTIKMVNVLFSLKSQIFFFFGRNIDCP